MLEACPDIFAALAVSKGLIFEGSPFHSSLMSDPVSSHSPEGSRRFAREVVLSAVQNDGMALAYAAAELQSREVPEDGCAPEIGR